MLGRIFTCKFVEKIKNKKQKTKNKTKQNKKQKTKQNKKQKTKNKKHKAEWSYFFSATKTIVQSVLPINVRKNHYTIRHYVS
jgi:uncharacterized ion transporter superfamily protein YfcC